MEKKIIRGTSDYIHNTITIYNDEKENYILEKTRGSYPLSTIPEGHIFAMGDNRNNSEDSRFRDVGFVPLEMIKGKAIMIFWPLNNIKTLP